MGSSGKPPLPWAGRRVLVTGADGFVGGWLVRALTTRGAEVHALVWTGRPAAETAALRETNARVVPGDITNLAEISELIAAAQIDTVYHLAASNINTGRGVSPYQVFETNIRGVYTLLEACRTAPRPTRAIIASSKEVEDCFRPDTRRKFHPYMTSKAATELVSRAYNDTFGLPVVLVRSDNLYGGGDLNWARLVPNTIRAILHGETPVIRSSGQLKRDYVYVEDAVAAYLAIGERFDDPGVTGQLFRVATGTATSVLAMVQAIATALGKPELKPLILNEPREERVDTLYTPEREQSVLGWKSEYSLETGLDRTCQWYRDYLDAPAAQPGQT